MLLSRRSLIALGAAGIAMPLISGLTTNTARQGAFERWRSDFEASMPARMRAAHVVGASVVMTSPSRPIHYSAAFGFADVAAGRKLTTRTPMHLASVSKLFTSTALMQLVERNGLDLHANVNDVVDFTVTNPRRPDLPITLHHLLTHTSSISDEGYPESLEAPGDPTQSLSNFLRSYLTPGGDLYSAKTSFSPARPGTAWDYSNVAMALVGYVVERLSKQDFSSYIERNLFAPLGIRNAHWYLRGFAPNVLAVPYRYERGRFLALPQGGYPDVPAGALRCSVDDLATSLQAMLGQTTGSKRLISPDTVAKMLSPQVDPQIANYQGLGWVEEMTSKRNVVGHSGADIGASNLVALTPDNSQAVAVLTNIDGTPKVSEFRASVAEDLLVGARLVRK